MTFLVGFFSSRPQGPGYPRLPGFAILNVELHTCLHHLSLLHSDKGKWMVGAMGCFQGPGRYGARSLPRTLLGLNLCSRASKRRSWETTGWLTEEERSSVNKTTSHFHTICTSDYPGGNKHRPIFLLAHTFEKPSEPKSDSTISPWQSWPGCPSLEFTVSLTLGKTHSSQ